MWKPSTHSFSSGFEWVSCHVVLTCFKCDNVFQQGDAKPMKCVGRLHLMLINLRNIVYIMNLLLLLGR